MKFEYANLWKEDGIFILSPMLIFQKENDEINLAFGWLIWGFEFMFTKRKVKKYAICTQPLGKLLTKGKEYQIIKSINNSYVVKRDDDSIDKVDKSRFSEVFMK
jgi:hypothetical protein